MLGFKCCILALSVVVLPTSDAQYMGAGIPWVPFHNRQAFAYQQDGDKMPMKPATTNDNSGMKPATTDDNSGKAAEKKCGLPSMPIRHFVNLDKRLGTVYGYVVLEEESSTFAPVASYDRLGKPGQYSMFPGTDLPAVISTAAFFSSQNDTCLAKSGPIYIAEDGRFFGHVIDANKGYVIPRQGFYLYNDYDTVEIFAECYEVKQGTRECVAPNIWVNTRIRPDLMSKSDKSKVDDIINKVVDRFCYDRSHFTEHLWGSDIKVCTAANSPSPSPFYGAFVGSLQATIDHRFYNVEKKDDINQPNGADKPHKGLKNKFNKGK